MKIAMIGQKGIPCVCGGIERQVEELSVRLAQAGHEVFVYTRPYYTDPKLKRYKGVNLISLPSIYTKHLDTISHTFLATCDAIRRGFDIIHYHGVGPSTLSFIPRMFSRAKVLATFHCQDKYHQKWNALARAYLSFGEWAACRFPHRTITISRILTKLCKKKFHQKTEYIPYGVEEKKASSKSLIERFGLEKNEYIISVTRLVKHKGIHYLIEAYKKLKTSKKLVIIGGSVFTNDYVQYLKKLAKDRKDIIFTGNQQGDTLIQLFKNAYLFVHPSESEGLPISLLEALSYGKCALVSDIPENLEGISSSGFAFKNKDIKDLRKKLAYLLANPEIVESTGQKAQQYVKECHSWNDITRKTIKLYKSLMKFPKFVLSKKEKQSLAAIKQTIGTVIKG